MSFYLLFDVLWNYLDIFERNDSFRDVFAGVLEVVEALVRKNEPPPLPGLPGPSLLLQPALLLRLEEGVHQVVVRLIRDLEGLLFNRLVNQFLEKIRKFSKIVITILHISCSLLTVWFQYSCNEILEPECQSESIHMNNPSKIKFKVDKSNEFKSNVVCKW